MRMRPADSGWIISGPRQYAAVAVARRVHDNLPIYVALAIAIAMPSVAFILRSLITAQGVEFGGAQAGREFGAGADMIAATAALVGFLQISLILDRVLAQRAAEFRLLEASVMGPGQILQLTLWESAAHAVIGWLGGSVLTGAAILLGWLFGRFPAPLVVDWLTTLAIALLLALVAVLLPNLSSLLRRFRSDTAMRQAGEP